ncbi:MAG: outer membrane lipoprotein chaperone LolA [Betaproteobacteria bacterium]|nr:outer membrane lipoprotein chaperone LolA [Betaproteobacteria bacterium]
MKMRMWGLAVVLAMVSAVPVLAGGIEELKSFASEVTSARMDFVQSVANQKGKVLQESRGEFEFARPGKFRWLYTKPYEQLIVGDGVKVWVYDKDLDQVTVKELGDALGSSPAALLAGSNDLDRAYTFETLPREGDTDWVEAVPKDADSSFEKMRIGFRKGNPVVMRLYDRLGQVTTIRFSHLERNPQLPASTFRFVPPPDADVVGDR